MFENFRNRLYRWQKHRRNAKDLARRLAETRSVVFHSKYAYTLPARHLLPVTSSALLGRDKSRDHEVCVVSIHNYDEPPILDQCMEHVDYRCAKTIRDPRKQPWTHTRKLILLHEFLVSECAADYLLYVDANDGVICQPPWKLIAHCESISCDVLFSATHFRGGYEYMPEMAEWWETECTSGLYLNAGVFFGKREKLITVLERAMQYSTEDDLTPAEHSNALQEGNLAGIRPNLPYGVGCDQFVLRYLLKDFYPAVQIDQTQTLAINRPTVFHWG